MEFRKRHKKLHLVFMIISVIVALSMVASSLAMLLFSGS